VVGTPLSPHVDATESELAALDAAVRHDR